MTVPAGALARTAHLVRVTPPARGRDGCRGLPILSRSRRANHLQPKRVGPAVTRRYHRQIRGHPAGHVRRVRALEAGILCGLVLRTVVSSGCRVIRVRGARAHQTMLAANPGTLPQPLAAFCTRPYAPDQGSFGPARLGQLCPIATGASARSHDTRSPGSGGQARTGASPPSASFTHAPGPRGVRPVSHIVGPSSAHAWARPSAGYRCARNLDQNPT